MAKSGSHAVAAAILFALVAILANVLTSGPAHPAVPPVPGRSNTVLFLVLPHHGLSNVHLATAFALLERHPQLKVEFASFPLLKKKVQRISASGQEANPEAKPIGFHSIQGLEYGELVRDSLALSTGGPFSIEKIVMPPGLPGIKSIVKDFALYVSPWPAHDHLETYHDIRRTIDAIDPAVVVLDTIFAPAMDATRDSNRLHAFITPNTLLDNFSAKQPWAGFFWKYPVVGSGHTYPVPLMKIPVNMYMAFRLIIAALYTPDIRAKRSFLAQHGLQNPIDFFNIHRDDSPWITQTLAAASVPLEFVPKNVSAVGPIVVSVAPVAIQDPELSGWLQQRPTIFINLGSSVQYVEERSTVMAGAIKLLLDQRGDVQVLWKMSKESEYSDDFKLPVQEFIDNGRLRLASWLHVDPTSILESGHVIASVHHGGANCYHETVLAGVSHVILPLWMDLYNFASLVNQLDIGVWGCPETSPSWTPECISEAILQVIDDGDAGQATRRKAQRVGEEAQKSPGRYGAARIIAELATSGY